MVSKKEKIIEFVLIIVLLIVAGIVCKANYQTNTFLTGWDNLHPEFNFKLNLWRSLNAVWQGGQGLGLLGGMAHAADLTRQLILWPFSFVLPINFLRYFWTFLMLGVGPVGVYFLITKAFLKKERNWISLVAGFLGAVFYIFNLATVQYFFTPFETFTSFYGFFPWLLYFALNYLKKGKGLLSFFFVSILATSAFYVQTMFVVYVIFLSVFASEAIFGSKILGFARSIKLALVTLFVNAFWLLPVIYFALTGANISVESKINSIATPETQLMNQARGDFSNVALLKGYWFDYYDFGLNGKFDYLYKNWIDYLKNPQIEVVGKIIFFVVLAGLVTALFRKKINWRFSAVFLLLLSYMMLATINPPLGFIYRFASEKIPLFADMFRNVFTKWSLALALIYALGIGFIVSNLGAILREKTKILIILPSIALILAILSITKPVFDGKLISDRLRVDIQKEYFDLFKFFEGRPKEGRIVNLPFRTFWGWNYNDWGYGGSGFIWYGLQQPVLDRAFDPWSSLNESFYAEASFILYQYQIDKGPSLVNRSVVNQFERVLEKYQVKYLLLDESIINPGGSQNLLFIPQIKDLISKSKNIKEIAKFNFLTVYQLTGTDPVNEIWATQKFTKVNVNQQYSEIDPIYLKFGDYINDSKAVSYPFVNFDKRMGVKINVDDKNLVFKKNEAKATFPIKEKISEVFGENRGFSQAYNCDLMRKGGVEKQNLGDKIIYRAFDGGVSCDFFDYPKLKYSQGYVLRIKGENKEGRGLKIYLQNKETGRMDLEELLPIGVFDEYFVILPKLSFNSGYSLNLETRSFGRIASENVVEAIEFIPIDTEFLITVKTGMGEPETVSNNLKIVSVKKTGIWYYSVETKGAGLLELGQGFDKGWIAFGNKILKETILEHAKVNSWANGWLVPTEINQVYIFYWPQLLEWGGMILGILTLLGLFLIRSKSH